MRYKIALRSRNRDRIVDRAAHSGRQPSRRVRIITIPRHNPVNAFTMGGIVRDAGLTDEEFRALL